MNLTERIDKIKPEILKLWFQEILDSFPADSRRFIAGNTDRFSNTIGFIYQDGIRQIFEALLGNKPLAEIEDTLGRIIKLRAVQDASPGDALDFLVSLKKIIRKNCDAYSKEFTENKELFEIEDRIDQIVLKAHQIYVQSREKISELKVNEMKNKTYMLRKMAGAN